MEITQIPVLLRYPHMFYHFVLVILQVFFIQDIRHFIYIQIIKDFLHSMSNMNFCSLNSLLISVWQVQLQHISLFSVATLLPLCEILIIYVIYILTNICFQF